MEWRRIGASKAYQSMKQKYRLRGENGNKAGRGGEEASCRTVEACEMKKKSKYERKSVAANEEITTRSTVQKRSIKRN